VCEYKLIIVGVDGGVDVVFDAGLLLYMIVGDMDLVFDKVLYSGVEVVVYVYCDGCVFGFEWVC